MSAKSNENTPANMRAQVDLQSLLRLLPKLNPIQDLPCAAMAPVSIHSDPRRLKTLLKVLTMLAPLKADVNRPLTMFIYFPKLPTEIQNRIWEFVAQEPREIRIWSMAAACFEPGWVNLSPKIVGQYPTPPLLHVCRHSRAEGLRYYHMCFSRAVEDLKTSIPLHGTEHLPLPALRNIIYANFAVDRFVYENRSEFSFFRTTSMASFNFDPEDMAFIQHIVIPHRQGLWAINLDRLAILLLSGSVKDLTFQVNHRSGEGKGEELQGELERLDKWVEVMRRSRAYLKKLRVLFEWKLIDDEGLLPPAVI